MTTDIEVFISYAHEDEGLRQGLEKQLRTLKRQGFINLWHDRYIQPGQDWEGEINARINSAHIILLLVSTDFIDSDYCYGIEVQRAMERHHQGTARVIPVILRPVFWQRTPFGSLQPLPTDNVPIVNAKWHSQDDAFFHVSEGIRAIIEERYSLVHGDQSFSQRKYKNALLAYDQHLNRYPYDTKAYINKGRVLNVLHRYKEALAAFDHALSLDAHQEDTIVGRGQSLYGLEQYAESLAAYEQVLSLNPNNASAYRGKSNVHNVLEQYDEALEACEKAIRFDSSEAQSYNSKGNILHSLGKHQEALSAYNHAIQLNPHVVFFYENKATVLEDLQRHKEAIETYKQALSECDQVLQLDPTEYCHYEDKGDILFNLKAYTEAFSAYEQAIRLSPQEARIYKRKGDMLFNLEKYTEALSEYEQAVQIDTNSCILYEAKGFCLLQLKRDREALQAFEAAIQVNYDSANAYYGKGEALYQLGRSREALVVCKKALNLNPNHADARSLKTSLLQMSARTKSRSKNRSKPLIYRCSFCEKTQKEVQRLIAGPGRVYICDECLDLCKEICEQEGIVLTPYQENKTSTQQENTNIKATTKGHQTVYLCSFCGKTHHQVQQLVAGPGGVYICDECIGLCLEIIQEEQEIIQREIEKSQ